MAQQPYKICPECQQPADIYAGQCERCGHVFSTPPPAQDAQTQYAPPPPGPAYHAQPGVVYTTPYDPTLKSKLAAGLLGLFFGTLGIHRFYLGYTTIGLVQLLLTLLTCGTGAIITGPWALVESIMIFAGSINVDGQGRPLRE